MRRVRKDRSDGVLGRAVRGRIVEEVAGESEENGTERVWVCWGDEDLHERGWVGDRSGSASDG